MMKRNILICWMLLFFVSCVSNKKTQYLQKNDVNPPSVQLDSVIRNYQPTLYEYKLQPEDILKVTVGTITDEDYNFFKTEFDKSVNMNLNGGSALIYGELIDEEGEIEYPVIGKVKVAGLTIFELQELLKIKAIEHGLKEPVVKVRLLNFRFTVIGETKKEGTFTTYNNRINLLEAIGVAGGFGDLADRAKIKLIRYKNNKVDVSYLDFNDENLINSPFFYLHQGDVLIVPPLKQRPFRKYFGENLALIVSSLTLLILVINTTK